ncbi:MAG: PAS domain-containing sensor histidine kinase [Synergistaceae bacterium]|nr:PAS domain-containing sensor histidine kinase [Synergistaceae bacterium]
MPRLSVKDSLFTAAAIMVSSGLCGILSLFGSGDVHVPLVFVLTVLVVSRLTEGYFYGIFTSIAAVFGVNYVFTYPYFAFDFTIAGYPLMFLSMLAVSLITSALTTQIKQQEKLRIETEKEKLRANLLRAISHDLRTPLTSIAGSTSILLEDENRLSGEQKRLLLQEVRDDALWLIHLMENLLSITRIGGEARIRKHLELLEELTGAAVHKFRKNCPAVHLRVTAPDEPIFVPMDIVLIEQVLVNLLENAVIHGKTLTHIDLSIALEDGMAVFSVENDGEWIDARVLPHIFDGYGVRADEKRGAGERRNMGIGLSVCRSIVKAHGGDIYAENTPPRGVRFRFSLPLKDMKDRADDGAKEGKEGDNAS